MTLLAVVGWLTVSVLLAPRIGRLLKDSPDPREPTHADPGPPPGSAFDVKWPWPAWIPYDRPSDWSPLLELFNDRKPL
jgi:hypothetical protein